jgi:homoserine O-acetyltransferase
LRAHPVHGREGKPKSKPRAGAQSIKDFAISYVTHGTLNTKKSNASPPEQGIRLWREILNFLAARSPEMYRDQFQNQLDVLPWLQAQEGNLIKAFDANDWIYQTWAYDRHDVGATPGMNGDTVKALRSIKAKTLILLGVKDLLNPEWEPQDAARYIRDVRVVTISPGTVTGHASAGGLFPADVDFLNRETSTFLDLVTERGKKLE